MAIIKSNVLPQDISIEIPNAYYRIEKIYGDKKIMSMKVSMYTSNVNSSPGKQLTSKGYTFIPSVEENSSNIFKQGYEHLMKLSEYSDGKSDVSDETGSEIISGGLILDDKPTESEILSGGSPTEKE